jgi:hypothetical protein
VGSTWTFGFASLKVMKNSSCEKLTKKTTKSYDVPSQSKGFQVKLFTHFLSIDAKNIHPHEKQIGHLK